MTQNVNEWEGQCCFCKSKQKMVEIEIPVHEYNDRGIQYEAHTISVSQCLNCKMIQPVEDE